MITYKNKNSEVPIKLWIDKKESIEESCIKQIDTLATLPYIYKHIAIMPDTHTGYGMPIGGVIACDNVIVPNCGRIWQLSLII